MQDLPLTPRPARWLRRYYVEFPPRLTLVATRAELEVDAEANAIRPGAKVRVKPEVDSPSGGWGGVSHQSVGEVTSVRCVH